MENIEKYVESLRKRYTLASMRNILTESIPGFKIASWDKLNESIGDSSSSILKTQLLEHIPNAYERLIKYNKKLVAFYKVDDATKEIFINFLQDLPKLYSDSKAFLAYNESYPLALEESQLEKIPTLNSLAFMKVSGTDNLSIVQMCSKIHAKINVDIDPSVIPIQYGHLTDIKGKKEGYAQSFDLLIFNHSTNILEILVDMSINDLLSDAISHLTHTILPEIKNSFEEISPNSPLKLENIDIFSQIQNLYLDTDGSISALEHIAPSLSTKKEKMPKNQDLRNEKFHNGGKNAISNQIKPFALTKTYEYMDGNIISLTIKGNKSMPFSENRTFLNYAIFDNCTKMEHMKFLSSKIIK